MKINLIEYFESTVASNPSKEAMVDANGVLTFDGLKKEAQKIAQEICRRTDQINKPIAIYLPKSNSAVASFLGIMYSGNIYTPLDIKNPMSRIEGILKVLGPACIITNNQCVKALENSSLDLEIINIDTLEWQADAEVKKYERCIDVDPAYILHTSGSTGVPKGVVISHKAIIDYISWVIAAFNVTGEERIGNQTPFIFDMSTLDLYLMIFKGATIFIIPEQHFIFPAKLLEFINEHQINFIFWVPSVLINIANFKLLDTISVPSLKKVLFGGEVMPSKHLGYWVNALGRDLVYGNLYGPTEITGTCSCYIVDEHFDENEPLPIGTPCRNTDILILNDKDKLCEIGEHGELCVRGTCLSDGYWNNPEKTAKVFVQNPLNTRYPELIYRTGDIVYQHENGNIMYIGRKDFQIKHFGYRIDIGEIEHAVLTAFGSINACVIYNQSKREIILVYEAKEEIKATDFRKQLTPLLSKYMIPTRYVFMNELPKTLNGKIDRTTLSKQLGN